MEVRVLDSLELLLQPRMLYLAAVLEKCGNIPCTSVLSSGSLGSALRLIDEDTVLSCLREVLAVKKKNHRALRYDIRTFKEGLIDGDAVRGMRS